MLIKYVFLAKELADTEKLALRLASALQANSVLALDGELGAGKTTFSQCLAKELGVSEVVNSPTFTIVKEYQGSRFRFFHMDVYRITLAQAEQMGLDEYFFGGGVSLVEWASIITECLPPDYLQISIHHAVEHGAEARYFELIPHGEAFETWCAGQASEQYLLKVET